MRTVDEYVKICPSCGGDDFRYLSRPSPTLDPEGDDDYYECWECGHTEEI